MLLSIESAWSTLLSAAVETSLPLSREATLLLFPRGLQNIYHIVLLIEYLTGSKRPVTLSLEEFTPLIG